MRHSIDSQWARVLRPAPFVHLLLEKHLHVVHYTLHCILYNSMSMQVMCIGLGDEVLVRTLWVKSLWSIDSLAGASVSLFSHGIVTWPMIPTSDKKGRSHRCFWNQSSDFGKTVAAKYMKSNLYTLVVGGFGHHCFEQDLLKSLEYSTSCNTQVTLDWTQGRIFSAEVSMVDVNKHSRLELRVGVVALAAEGSSVLVFYKNSSSSTCCPILWK